MKRIITSLFVNLFVLTTLLAQGNQPSGHTEKDVSKNQGKAITLNEKNFNRLVTDLSKGNTWNFLGKRPCLIDFYADWCGPCRMLAPVISELAKDYQGQIDVYKVNIDYAPNVARAFGIQSIPTLLFVPMNDRPTLMQGAAPKSELVSIIDSLLIEPLKVKSDSIQL